MQAPLLDIPLVVTDRERADEWADQLEDFLLEVGRVSPRADLRRRAAACVRGLLGPLSRKKGWQLAEHAGDARPDGGGNCVEAGPLGDGTERVAVRHSHHPDAEVIVYTRAEWEAFLKGVRNGEFDFFTP
jgi:hypothetical protein